MTRSMHLPKRCQLAACILLCCQHAWMCGHTAVILYDPTPAPPPSPSPRPAQWPEPMGIGLLSIASGMTGSVYAPRTTAGTTRAPLPVVIHTCALYMKYINML
ncbi:hypothetical protein BJ912DRAFT_623023 [Pholiota molesta]|nr:hypothetical protein BJ912DRAFT_623023 [Pholiota molesta]